MCAGAGGQLIVHEDSVDFGRDSCYNLAVPSCHLTGSGSPDGATIYESEAYATERGGVDMATQIAPTPVVKGTAAVKIYKEANQKRSQASKNGAEKLKQKFSKKLK